MNQLYLYRKSYYDYPIVSVRQPVRDLQLPFRLTGPPCRDTFESLYNWFMGLAEDFLIGILNASRAH